MRKHTSLILVALFLAVCAGFIYRLSEQKTEQAIVRKSLNVAALEKFGGEMDALTQAQIAAQRAEVNARQMKIEEERAETQARINFIPFKVTVKKAFWVGFPVMLGVCSLVLSVFGGVGILRQKSVFVAKIDGTETPVLYADLPKMVGVAMGAIQAKIQAAFAGNQEQAYEQTRALLTDFADLARGFGMRRGLNALQPINEMPHEQPAALPAHVPSFKELLNAGEVAEQKPLIFGFERETGQPEKGDLSDLYSTVIIGLSGYGKTTALSYLIGSSILATRAVFNILDAHHPSPESLGATLGELIDTPYVKIHSNPLLLDDVLEEEERELDRRLSMTGETFQPRIMVIDEHERWAEGSKRLVKFELRIVNEGRKVGMYLFLTSKSAKGDKIGDTALRDNCVTSYCFRTKPHNAKTFFKDSEKEKLVKTLTKPGEALFVNRKDEAKVVNLPFASSEDMAYIRARVIKSQATQTTPKMHVGIDEKPAAKNDKSVTAEAEKPTPGKNVVSILAAKPLETSVNRLKKLCGQRDKETTSQNQWIKATAEEIGVSDSLLKNILLGHAAMSEETAQKVEKFLKMKPV